MGTTADAMTNLPHMNLNIFQWLQDIKAKYHFVKFIKNPTDTHSIFKMAKSFQYATPEEMVMHVMKPALSGNLLQSDFENRVWYKHPKMAELKKYPEGSFGRETALFFEKHNLDENLFPKADFGNIVDYVTSRIYQTHDFWHVLTGYSVELEDELALQSFAIGQYQQPISLTIIAGGIIHILQKHPERTIDIMNSLTKGYERGQKAKFLLDINIFDYLDKQLKDVRREFNLDI